MSIVWRVDRAGNREGVRVGGYRHFDEKTKNGVAYDCNAAGGLEGVSQPKKISWPQSNRQEVPTNKNR